MKIRKAILSAPMPCLALGALIALPGLATADFTGCEILIDEGGFTQGACPGDIIRTQVTEGGFSMLTDVNTGNAAGGVATTQSLIDTDLESNFTVRTGGFYDGVDNSGTHITSDAFQASLDIQQKVILDSEANTDVGDDVFESFVNFSHRLGSTDGNGNTSMVAFNNIMNGPGSGPGADGSRYAPDARFLSLDGEGRFLDLSSPDSRLHFRFQSAEWVDPDLDDARYIRFGQNRTDGDHKHWFAFSQLEVGGTVVAEVVDTDISNFTGLTGDDRHTGLAAVWGDYTSSAENGGLTYGDDFAFYDFRDASFFHNTNFVLADGEGGYLNTPGSTSTPPDATGLSFGEEINNPNYAGPFGDGVSHPRI